MTDVAENLVHRQRWSRWTAVAFERLPLPFPLTVVILALVAGAEQVLEYSLIDPRFSHVSTGDVNGALIFVGLLVYILLHLRLLKQVSIRALVDLRPAVLIGDQEYEEYARRMVSADRRIELALLAGSIAVVALIFGGLSGQIWSSMGGRPPALPLVVFIAANYVLLGWLLLSLAYAGVRHSQALSALARAPLRVNAFDPSNLLPFGRLSLLHSLSVAGAILIPLILRGPPTQVTSYMVTLLSVASLLAIFIPLWGVHRQIVKAKEAVADNIYEQLFEIQETLLHGTDVDAQTLKMLSDRTGMLVNLRKTLLEAPSWPFRSEAALVRATLAATSPLIYFIINRLIQIYLLPGQ